MARGDEMLTRIEQLKQQKELIEKQIKDLEEREKSEQSKNEWLYIPKLKIEVQTKIHHLDKTLAEARQDLKEGQEVISYEQIQWLRNSKYAEQLNLINTWEFVYPNPDKISENNNYVVRFYADSNGAILDCYWNPASANSALGVRFVRDKK